MIHSDYRLPIKDVKLVHGRRLHYKGKHPDPTSSQSGRWKHPCGLRVIASFGPIPEIGPCLHVSLSYKDGREVSEVDVAEVALAFFPAGVNVYLAQGGALGPVVHLMSDEHVQGVAQAVIPLAGQAIREMLGKEAS